MSSDDPSYYAARAVEERRLAMAAADPKVRRVHLELAAKYAEFAGGAGEVSPEQGQETA